MQSKMAADSGMDTCPSPENPDSRKRPLDGDVENGSTKRSHYIGGKISNNYMVYAYFIKFTSFYLTS